MNKRKRKLKADFVAQMRACEINYRALLKMLPQLHARESWSYLLDQGDGQLRVDIEHIERSRYTNTLLIKCHHKAQLRLSWWPNQPIIVRLYHDARVAEVLSDTSFSPMPGDYAYPNNQMLERDEKLQRNYFLMQLLKHCLAHAYVADNLIQDIVAE